jgi:hypothetical protein
MAKGNRRLRSVVEGAMDATKDARRAAAAEKIRATVATTPPPAPAPAPAEAPPAKQRRPRRKPADQDVEPDTKLESSSEQRVPDEAPQMSPEEAQRLRETMLQSSRPKKPVSRPTKPAVTKQPTSTRGFAPIRGPGALLGRLLKETYRQAPNIAANAVAIPAFTAAGAGGIYLGTAGTLAAIRGINKLLTPEEEKKSEPLALPAPSSPPPADDYRSGFQRAIEQRRKPRTTDSGFDVIRSLSRTRGLT